MKLYVDDKMYEINNKELLVDISNKIYDDIKREKRIVEYISINNEKYKFVDDWFNRIQFEELITVKFVTKDLDVLVDETIEELRQYIPKLINSVDLLINSINTNQFEIISDIFINFIYGLEWVKEAINNICQIRNKPYIIHEGSVNNVLKEILQAWEIKDYVLISDIIQYEIKPLLEKCNNSLNELLTNFKS
jgi:hypothetical protein